MKFAVVFEKAENNYSAWVPDLIGCVATGDSLEQAEAHIREAIELHLQGLKEEGQPVPVPSSAVEYVEVAA